MNQINRKTSFNLVILPLLFLPLCLSAQVKQNKFLQHSSIETLRQATRVAELREKSKRDSSSYMLERAAAIRFANENGYPVSGNFEGREYALQGFDDFGFLRYNQTTNAISALAIDTDQLYPGGDAGLSLTGNGRVLGVWEVSRPRATHNELNGRLTQVDNSTQSIGNHATHVSGTMIAAGVNPNARGMAYQANLVAFDSNNDLSEMATAAAQGLQLSNHSYGIPTGWEYGDYSGSTGWHWFGNTSISSSTDYKFGLYDSDTRELDNLVFNAPLYLPVRSVGNDRNDSGPNPGGQHWVRNSSGQWVSSTTTRQPDGGAEGYDCITTEANAKNILTVGAVEGQFTSSFDVYGVADFSSYGPTDDGRIKPDIVARGVDVFSSIGSSNSSYGLLDGTSMATPSVTGSLELLLQHYENLHPGFTLRNSALKALVIHTAANNRPDYKTGWGLMNTRAAADVISSDAEGEGDVIFSSVTIENNENFLYFFYHDGSGDVKATIAWTDPAGSVSTNTLNPTALRLVNDLDMRLISESDNTVYEPWQLNPAAPASAATKGDNFRDNVEQIRENLPAGYYVLLVGHKGNLSGGSQAFSLILSGISEEPSPTCSGNTTRTTCSGTITDGSGSKNYTNDLDCSWTITPTNAVAVTLNFTEFNTESGFDFVRVYNGTNANAPLLGEFSGNSLPPTLTANSGKMYLTFTSDELSTRPGWSAGYSCTTAQLSVNPSSFNFSANGGSNSLNLTANCAWSIQNIPSWLMLTPTSGSANATVSVTCAPNTGQQSRSVTLTITGCNGLSQTITISQSGCAAPSVPTISAGGPTSLCPGETVTLTAANVCGTCTVNWSNGMTGPSITVAAAGTYAATQSNACGQSSTSNSIAVSVGQAPTSPTINAGGPTSLCPGETVTLTAANVCGTCTVNWSNGMTGPSISVSSAGTYTATQSNACGQSSVSNAIAVSVGQAPAAPTISAGGPTSLCPGETVTLTAANVCGTCTVNWSNGMTGPSITVAAAGTYTATQSNACGQSTASNSIAVSVGQAPAAPTITAGGPTSLCPGETVTLTAANVCGTCTVNWSNGMTGPSITVAAAGTYTATQSNACGQSLVSNAIAVSFNSLPPIPLISANGSTALCPGQSLTLAATNVCGGCTVSWSNGLTGPVITISNAGAYTARYENSCGEGPVSQPMSVTAEGPFAPVVQVNNLCYLAAPPGSNYAWYFNGTLIPDATGQFWTAASTGYYYVSMLSPAGCPGTSAPVFAEKCVSGVSDLNTGPKIRLYPNPAHDRVWMELVSLADLPEARLLLYTLDGRLISTLFSGDILAGTQSLEIELPDLPAGIYPYSLISAQGAVRGSLLILD